MYTRNYTTFTFFNVSDQQVLFPQADFFYIMLSKHCFDNIGSILQDSWKFAKYLIQISILWVERKVVRKFGIHFFKSVPIFLVISLSSNCFDFDFLAPGYPELILSQTISNHIKFIIPCSRIIKPFKWFVFFFLLHLYVITFQLESQI